MPALQISAATVASLINGNQADSSGKSTNATAKKSGGDPFASLLDVVGNLGDPASKKEDIKEPVANVIEQPSTFRSVVTKDKPPVNDEKDFGAKARPANDTRFDQRKSEASQQAKNADEPDNSNRDTQASEIQPKQNVNKTQDNNSESKDVHADGVESEEELKAKKLEPSENLSNLMDIFAQLLAGAGNISGDKVVSGDAADYLNNATQALDIIANVKDLLAKIKDLLQSANAQNAPLSDEQTAALNQLNSLLKADLDSLKALFPEGLGLDDRDSLFSKVLQAAQGANPDGAFGNKENFSQVLESDIEQIKELLQKFRGANSTSTSQVDKQTTNGQTGNGLTEDFNLTSNAPRDNNRVQAAVFSSVVATTVTEQVISQPAHQQQNTANILSVNQVVQAVSSDGSSNANSGSNSGQGGNSQGQFSLGGLSQAASRVADNTSHSQFSNLLNRTTHAPVVEQVAFQVKSAVASGNSKITIQLNPEDLGKLDITLDIDAKGKTGVTVTADNKQTLDLLQRDSQALQKALSDAGLKADSGSLSFNLRGGDREGQGQNQNESHAANKYQKSQAEELMPEEVSMAAIATVTRSYVVNMPDGLNIKI